MGLLSSQAAALVMWDVVEDHLEEAAFLHEQWEVARISPHYTAAEVASGPEERLLANLDGLVVPGLPVAERLLVPALGDPELGRSFSAAWALTAIEGGLPLLLEALDWTDPHQRGAAARGLELSLAPGLDEALLRDLEAGGPPDRRSALLRAMAFRRWPLDGALLGSLDLENPETQRAVLRARWTRPGVSRPVLDSALKSHDAATRDAAISHGLALRVRAAWDACREAAAAPGPEAAHAWLLHSLLGEDSALAPVEAGLGDPATRKAALWALGFSGRPRAVELLLPHLADEAAGRVAGEAFSAITGVALVKELAKPPVPAGDGEEEAQRQAPEADFIEEHLPVPEPEAVAAWWAQHRRRFDPRQRYLDGKPLTAEVLAAGLDQGPMRRRAALALELRLRTGGEMDLETDAWVRAQEKLQAGARAAERLDFQESLVRHLAR